MINILFWIFLVFCFDLFCLRQGFLCGPECPGTCCIEEDNLELRNPPVSLLSTIMKGVCCHAWLEVVFVFEDLFIISTKVHGYMMHEFMCHV